MRRRTALGRLVDALRRRLRPDPGAPPATVPGLGSGEETALAAAAQPQPEAEAAAREDESPAAELPVDADARFDAARDRLRARIEPPAPDDE